MKNKQLYTICLSEATHEKGVKKAEELGISFSAYLTILINKDNRE